MATASDLPIELHAEILVWLHHFKDRPTLLSTALVSKDWCKISQRILFGTFTDDCCGNFSHKARVRGTHVRFLQTIAEYPQRLGPLVRSYAQDLFASKLAATQLAVSTMTNIQLWDLTAEALSAMINLKHLYLRPESDYWPATDDWISSIALLHSFNFQLETLMWKFHYHPLNGLSDFLRTQNNLIHVEIGDSSNNYNLSWLADDFCPHLISVSGGYGCLIHIARRRRIIAWKCDTYHFPNGEELVWQGDSSALDALRYISVCDYTVFRAIIGPRDLNIVLLELTEAYDIIKSLANMPKLRVLVVIQRTYTIDEVAQGAVGCFARLPSLEYIIQRTSHRSWNGYRYRKVSLAPGSKEDILREELMIDYDLSKAWWMLYNV